METGINKGTKKNWNLCLLVQQYFRETTSRLSQEHGKLMLQTNFNDISISKTKLQKI